MDNHNHQSQAQAPQPPRSCVSSTDDQPGPDKTMCIICHSYVRTSELTTLPCGHSFGHRCIVTWTQAASPNGERSHQCPMCRAQLLYKCGCIVSVDHLRPGVSIFWEELALNCQRSHPGAPYRLRDLQQLDGLEEPEEQAGNLPLEQPQVAGAAQPAQQVQRPKHHDFLFRKHLYPPGQVPQTWEYFCLSLKGAANALDRGDTGGIELVIGGYRGRLLALKEADPYLNIAVSPSILADLVDRWTDLKRNYRVFKRQHEGFIELNEVAVAFRDKREAELRQDLHTFWDSHE
ncbi:hypothetical protein F5Y05DRAFT_358429 [Hypoxylon sp. FL0543]|nr:hypothetical protein F5Y05DRAFT_358429 [Hypoxylon sp. FL0543]